MVTHPDETAGGAMWRIARAAGLDRNSPYAYLMFCRDFPDTCAVAELAGDVVGFVMGYRRPRQAETLFVWQIGVLEVARGTGVAAAMLDYLVESVDADTPPGAVQYLEATVTPDNGPSAALFGAFARRHSAPLSRSSLFGAEHFAGLPGEPDHGEEILLRIGPLSL